MTDPPRAPDERPSIEVVTNDSDWIVGLELAGKYRVDYFVAEGGYGAVYAGQDLRLGVPVAVKVLKAEVAGAGTLRRRFEADFLEETRIVARLRHPNIVRVHDVGVTSAPDGGSVPWMAMEWLAGETLQQSLRRRREAGLDARMAPAQAVALLRPVFDAIAYAHEQRVAHRDLKPANIMLVPDRRGALTPYVLDFGVAKAFAPCDGRPGSGETATRTPGEVGFTAAYAAVEQVTRTRTGPWTDVHALALILCELLVGRKAYEGSETPELLACAFREERPTPAHFGVDVGRLEPVLRRALSIRAGDRYPDAQRFLDAVDEALAAMGPAAPPRAPRVDPGERSAPQVSMKPIECPKPRPPRRPPPSWRDPVRERLPLYAAVGVVTALAALWSAGTSNPRPPGPARTAHALVSRPAAPAPTVAAAPVAAHVASPAPVAASVASPAPAAAPVVSPAPAAVASAPAAAAPAAPSRRTTPRRAVAAPPARRRARAIPIEDALPE